MEDTEWIEWQPKVGVVPPDGCEYRHEVWMKDKWESWKEITGDRPVNRFDLESFKFTFRIPVPTTTGVNMTFQEFKAVVYSDARPSHLRLGQWAMNKLREYSTNLYNQFAGSTLDPFNRDYLVHEFMRAVEEGWPKPPQEDDAGWEDFVPVVGEKYPDVYRYRYKPDGEYWFEGLAHGLIQTPDNASLRYQKPVTPKVETEMTTALWDSMTTQERCAYNLPAFMALGEGKKVETLYCGDEWGGAWNTVDLLTPRRVKHEPPKSLEYWITTFPDGSPDDLYEEEHDAREEVCKGGRVVRMIEAPGDDA